MASKTAQNAVLRQVASGGRTPKFNHGRHLKKAAQQFKKNFEDLDSTKYAEMMQKTEGKYGHLVKPEYPEPVPMKWQLMTISGNHGLGKMNKKKYPNAAYFDLISKIVPLRHQFRKTHKG